MSEEIFEWLQFNCDNLIIYRDKGIGIRFVVEFCYESTGCPGSMEVKGGKIQDALELAIIEQQK